MVSQRFTVVDRSVLCVFLYKMVEKVFTNMFPKSPIVTYTRCIILAFHDVYLPTMGVNSQTCERLLELLEVQIIQYRLHHTK